MGVFSGSLPEGYAPVEIETREVDHSNDTVYVYGYGRSQDFKGTRSQLAAQFSGQLRRGVMQIGSHYDRYDDRYDGQRCPRICLQR